jgi:hypothetical protein
VAVKGEEGCSVYVGSNLLITGFIWNYFFILAYSVEAWISGFTTDF